MRGVAGAWMMPVGIGAGFGLLAGLIGAAQWALTQHDLAERLGRFHAIQRQYPGFFDETNVDRGNFLFWFGTAILAAFMVLVVCELAALTASRMRGRWVDGMIAAIVAAILGGTIYAAAASLAVATSPAPSMTQEFAQFAPAGAIIVYICALFLAPLFAGAGALIGASDRQAT
jgi:hypothetical protein